MDIAITTPVQVNDFWAYARQLTEEEWAGYEEDRPYSVTLTGATDARDAFVSTNVGLDLIRAIEAEIFILRDTQGRPMSPSPEQKQAC